ncbi:DAK2 domain-containing protein [Clostridium perfringens]|uniref:DAK2 domain-containing protein n=1 Tax=Clostridium perfringens F262 TaxID=883064 RepID=A0AAV3FBB0_CLOPF|nr:DAK2 domain-containing protein [Clostridium perfringens]EIA16582.1 DAK2 domain-containing protein [Clostridium perfringens F262]ELC8366018.1 DAK2 domain-containing protein [Clostridium perfringens]ELC8394663.1 DAK2 domain-containing protein [Clostridium perfringens]ELC8452274.1 DAK2 domain-containing protein [Clostridium perfringens]MBO3342748.1 DAK2 domain-containing protein [Clostridium perfringens]
MKFNKVNGEHLYYMMSNAANKLELQSEYVNSLNVFPVPDGDTGTNMSMTFRAAVKEIEGMDNKNVGEVSKKLAKGALMGARGNSGVILSQILRGISKGLEGKEEADASEFANALLEGSKSAYKAVMRPTEGTILTIVRTAGEVAVALKEDNITELMREVCRESKIMLDKTPEMLPALKKAKVVDSGGMGLLIILQGMQEALENGLKVTTGTPQTVKSSVAKAQRSETMSEEDIKFGYCTEFIILGDSNHAEEFKSKVINKGDSLVVVGYEDVIKVHIHTNNPGKVLEEAVKYGELSKIKIDNMREEHREMLEGMYEEAAETEESVAAGEFKKYAFISVAMGEGMKNIFKDLGVDYVIEGGQTMNPSTQDMLEAIEKLNAEHIFILPNNKNIIMAANQAAEISDKDIRVIPTKTIPQGITCITMFNPEADVEENTEELKEAMEMVKTTSVTYAVRDTEVDGKEIKEGNILGLVEGKIKEVGEDPYKVAEDLIDSLVDEDSELITIFYGKDCEEEKVDALIEKLEGKYEDLDVQCYKGEQPLYYFIMSVE